ncbi:MAG: M16 family metallopeptidase [Gemmatimonadaceae bacterium]
MNRSIAVAAAIVALATSAAAQTGARRKPTTKPAPSYAFPKVQTRTLPNGMTVEIVENHSLPLVAVRTVIEGGALLDPQGKEGLYALDIALLRDGTTSMNGVELAQALDELGATVTPTSFTTITGELDKALPLMGDMLMHPTFAPDAVDRRKAALKSTLQRAEGDANAVANRLLNTILFGPEHPFGRAATQASVSSITRDDLVAFHSANVRPQNVTLVIVGDVTPTSVMPLVTTVFGGWEKTGERVSVKVPSGIASQPTYIYLFDRPGAPQTTVRFGQVGPMRSSPDYYAFDLAMSIFGATGSSQLAQSLREQHKLTYSVTHVASWRGWNEPSVIVGSAQVDAAKTDSALLVWMSELKNFADTSHEITPQDLEFGRSVTVGSLATRFETFDAIANEVVSMVQNHLPMTFVDDYVHYVKMIPAKGVSIVAHRFLNPTHTAIIVVGDRKTIELPLRAANVGPVIPVDATGKSIP